MTTKSINLLPKEEKKRDVRSVVLNVFVALVIILLLATILLTFFLFDIDNVLSARLSEYEGVNIKTQDQVNKLKVYNDFKSDVNAKTAVIEDLKKDELLWSRILYDIGKLMPEDVYIRYFEAFGSGLYKYLNDYKEGEIQEGSQVMSFRIIGEAATYMDVLKFTIELKKIENIKVVWIVNITKTTYADIELDVVTFTINTYWNLEPFTQDLDKKVEDQDEDILDSEISEIEG